MTTVGWQSDVTGQSGDQGRQYGKRISHYRTKPLLITQSGANPLLVTATGAIVTSKGYALYEDTSTPGNVTNRGTLQSTAATGIGVEFSTTGTLHNDGLVSGGADGAYFDNGTGEVTNSGLITATGTAGIGVAMRTGGVLSNGSHKVPGGVISGGLDGVLMNDYSGTVQNYGTITGIAGNGVEIDNSGGGTTTVTNGASGTLSSYLISGANDAVYSGSNATITNYGTLVGKLGDGIYVGGGGTINNGDANDVGRVISGVTWGLEFYAGTGTVNNFGSISATGTASAAAYLHSGGTVINGSAAVTGLTISGGLDGVLMNDYSGTVQNYGTITGIAGNGVEIDNSGGGTTTVTNGASGTLSSYLISGANDAVYSGSNATITNYGTLVGKLGDGIYVGGGGTINNGDANDVGRVISGVTWGLEFYAGTGTVNNFGSISATGTASAAAYLHSGGTVINGSAAVTGLTISGGLDGVLMNDYSGTVQNYGTITGIAGNGVEIDNSGGGTTTVTNGASGTLSSYLISGANDAVYSGSNATITNYGTLVGKLGDGIYVGGGGTINNGDANDVGRVISGVTWGLEFYAGTGTVNNFGSISATGTASAAAYLHSGGTVINGSAAVTGLTISGGLDGVLMNDYSGTVQNYGTITGVAGNGVEIDNSGGGTTTVTNGASGTLSSYLISGANDAVYSGSNATITNYGTLVGKLGDGIYVGGGGTINNGDANDVGRVISGVTWGLEFYAGTGTVNNFGSISATGTASAAAYLHSGGTVINGSAAVTGLTISGGLDGVLMNDYSGTVQNYGTITGIAGNGVEIDNSGGGTTTVTNGASGTLSSYLISGANDAVYSGSNATITNYGTLVGKLGDGIYVGGGGTINNGDANDVGRVISGVTWGLEFYAGTGTVNNFGSISATGTASAAAYLHSGGTVINGSAAVTGLTISGGLDGVLMNDYSGTVQNYGTITGVAGNGVEIDNSGGGTTTVTNGASGVISGVVGIVTGGPSVVTNAGTITGTGGTAIQFSNGNDTIVLNAGATFNGIVDGGGGTNTIELAAGTGVTGSIGSEFIDFAGIDVDVGATWTLTGSSSIGIFVDDGNVTLSASATLSITGSIDSTSSGIFNLGLNSVLDVMADVGSQSGINFIANADLDIKNASMFGTNVGMSDYVGPEIHDFTAGDMIDLRNITAGATLDYTASTGLLQVSSGSTDVATLFFDNSTLGQGSFHIGDDGAGHALITHS